MKVVERTVVAAALLLMAVSITACGTSRPDAPSTVGVAPSEQTTWTDTSSPTELSPVTEATGALLVADVVRVVDGDTLHVRTAAGTAEKVRLIGVDSPEVAGKGEPFGREATAFAKKRLPAGTHVWLQTDTERRDDYGRLLAYLWLRAPGSAGPAEVRRYMFNAQLLEKGYAQLMTVPPNVRHVETFKLLQEEARTEGAGLWGER